jgi:serine/threonine protein kinase
MRVQSVQANSIQGEIQLMENLRHPNIVTLLGTQRSGNKLSILMVSISYVPACACSVALVVAISSKHCA